MNTVRPWPGSSAHGVSGGSKGGLPHDSIGTLADDVLNVILLADIEGNLPGAAPALYVAHGCPGYLKLVRLPPVEMVDQALRAGWSQTKAAGAPEHHRWTSSQGAILEAGPPRARESENKKKDSSAVRRGGGYLCGRTRVEGQCRPGARCS